MEILHEAANKSISGRKIFELLSVLSDNNDEIHGTTIKTDELREQFVFGNKLASGEILLVDGKDVIERLPQPESFGNRRLALMDLLDTVAKDALFAMTVRHESQSFEAAD